MITKRKVRKGPNQGKYAVVIDLMLTRRDGTQKRIKWDAKIQTHKGAKLEEETILRQFFETDTFPVKATATARPKVTANRWEDALDHYRKTGLKTLKESSRHGFDLMYESQRFAYWHGWELTKIDTKAINDWQMWVIETGFVKKGHRGKLSESLLHHHRAALLAVLKAVGPDEQGNPGPMLVALPSLPTMPRNLLKPPKTVKAPSPGAVEKILAAATPELRFAFELARMLGVRAGEVRALVKEQFDLEAREVTIDRNLWRGILGTPKGGTENTIPIEEELLPLLKERLAKIGPKDFVCVDEQGNPWGSDALGYRFNKLKKSLGLKFDQRVHALRHFFGKETIQVTDLKSTSVLMRHKHVATTERYLSTDRERLHAAVQAKAKLRAQRSA